MFKTIRSQISTILFLFTIITATCSIIIINSFIKRKNLIIKTSQQIEKTYILLLKDIKITHEFLENETINPVFFKTKKSKLLTNHLTILNQIEILLNEIYNSKENKKLGLDKEIALLKGGFTKYKILTNEIVNRILIRGFKDYGIEGEMRNYAHMLESYDKEIGLVNILQLRRHEKDYIIRQENQYALKHELLINNIKNELILNQGIENGKKTVVIELIDNYSSLFKQLIKYEKIIGLKTGGGIKKEIETQVDKIENTFTSITSIASLNERIALINLQIFFAFIWITLIIICVFASIFISKKISHSIISLKEKITEFVKSDFTIRTTLPINSSENEIDILTTNFSIMEQHIVNQVRTLKQTNKELETLFCSTSNEIKFPLKTIKSIIENAKQTVNDSEALKHFELIDRSWENLAEVINELGMVSDIKDEKYTIEKIDFESLIQSIFSEFRLMPNYNDIIFSLYLNIDEEFHSSPRLIETIFRNLIENAIKYSVKRNTFSFLKIKIFSDKNNMLKIIVSDNGLGIPKEYHDKIFEMFFRGKINSSGTGLGLFIVQNSLQRLKGAISVESDENSGSTFTILLPNGTKNKNILERLIQKRELHEIEDNLVIDYI